jgi:NADPH:quinone reductase-like Zn-dependent oxidoreductase
MAAGYLRGMMEHEFPAGLGRDFAGTVDAVGDGVTAFAPGDDVFGVVLTQPAAGRWSGRVSGDSRGPQRGPDPGRSSTTRPRACSASPAPPPRVCLDTIAPGAGETVLISGATGRRRRRSATQLAVARGATVIATAKPGPETEYVTAQGRAPRGRLQR